MENKVYRRLWAFKAAWLIEDVRTAIAANADKPISDDIKVLIEKFDDATGWYDENENYPTYHEFLTDADFDLRTAGKQIISALTVGGAK